MKVRVVVEPSSSFLPIIAVLVLLTAGSGAAYYFLGRKKKS
jgi:flagellar basal body-associated protein FliL